MNISSIETKFGSACNWLSKRKWINKASQKNLIVPEAFAAAFLVQSIVSKDLVGMALYTSQSWYNKRIPEEKRKFVALTDFTNGIIMVGGQLLAGRIIEKKWGNKIYGKYFSGQNVEIKDGVQKFEDISKSKAPLAPDNIYERCVNALADNKEKFKKMGVDITNPDTVKELGEKMVSKYGRDSKRGKALKSGFGIIVVALGTTAFVKRTLAPLISTPAASWIKHKYVDEKPFKDDDIVNSKSIRPQQKHVEQPKKPVDVKA